MPVNITKLFSLFNPFKIKMSNERSSRFFPNNLPDYDGKTSFLDWNGQLDHDRKVLLHSNFNKLLYNLEKDYFSLSDTDRSVYTGSSGHALLYLKLYETQGFDSKYLYITKASTIVSGNLFHNRKKITVPTFLCGEVGQLTVAVLTYKHLNKNYQEYLDQILSIHQSICENTSAYPDELLYGRSGYLYSLLLIRSKIPESNTVITDDRIRSAVRAILASGVHHAQTTRTVQPLAYVWQNDAYVGAAHGYAGILYMLLESIQFISQRDVQTLIKPTIDWLIELQFPSGNFPACLGDYDDSLVHWCHGSPGLVYLLAKAYKVFRDEKYLNAALKAGENIWQKGLLKKGYGLCHGTSGNAYSLLKLYDLTKDQKYLHRAWKFAEWCFDYGKHQCRQPDTPYSLFEGMAGTIHFLADFMDPTQARFPGFQLS